MKICKRNNPLCRVNISCAVYHTDGICPDSYSQCNCEESPKPTQCEEHVSYYNECPSCKRSEPQAQCGACDEIFENGRCPAKCGACKPKTANKTVSSSPKLPTEPTITQKCDHDYDFGYTMCTDCEKPQANFVQVGEGHCFICHRNTSEYNCVKQAIKNGIDIGELNPTACISSCDKRFSVNNPYNKPPIKPSEVSLSSEWIERFDEKFGAPYGETKALLECKAFIQVELTKVYEDVQKAKGSSWRQGYMQAKEEIAKAVSEIEAMKEKYDKYVEISCICRRCSEQDTASEALEEVLEILTL